MKYPYTFQWKSFGVNALHPPSKELQRMTFQFTFESVFLWNSLSKFKLENPLIQNFKRSFLEMQEWIFPDTVHYSALICTIYLHQK